jgi:single-stranded DNA-specific DHH superfamily exonuclease
MLTNEQLKEIREHLENAKNPIFFFDNDVDGLCSFLILQRYIGRGKGVAIRGHSNLSKSFFKRVEELKADYIFVLDRAVFEQGFIDLANEANIPIVGIDHHDIPKPNIEHYYNTFEVSKKTEPTAYLCYKATERKEDMWLAVLGSIADCFIPEFFDEFKKQYPGLAGDYKTAYDIRYNTDFGKMIHLLGYGLFDKTSNVLLMLKFLMKAKGPYDVLEENAKTKTFFERYEYINKKIQAVISKAEEEIDTKSNLLFFTYSGDMSVSQYVSDELNYKHPELVRAVGFVKGGAAKFSIRGSVDVRVAMLNAIKDIEGATGGGHKNSCGAQMTEEDVPKFRKNLIKEIEEMRKEKD